LKIKVLSIIVIVISFIAVTGVVDSSGSVTDNPLTASGTITSGNSFFFFHVNMMETAYLSGNSDFGSGQQSSLYIEPATGGTCGDNAGSESPNGLNPQPSAGGATKINGKAEQAPAEESNSNGVISTVTNGLGIFATVDNQYQGIGTSLSASNELKKIPSWFAIGCLAIDVIISLLLLSLALMKKI
jgi:hypothetical protein